jgi:hypothetical protein
MYSLSDEQIEFILNDIRNKGISMEDLQEDLLDHICCLIEEQLKEGDDFETGYNTIIKQFYKKNLYEIEEETMLLLRFKNYYTMKKLMIISGMISVAAFVFGSIFKLMQWPGTVIFLVAAMVITSLVFLPSLFFVKSREITSSKQKVVLAIGTLVAICFCVGTLFKIQHWPGASVMWLSAIGVSFFIFIPAYFLNGMRNPETKINTIISTILIVIATGVQFTLINTRPARKQTESKMHMYIQSNDLLNRIKLISKDTTGTSVLSSDIFNICEEIKGMILKNSIGQQTIPSDFEARKLLMEEGNLGNQFFKDGQGKKLLTELKNKVTRYNELIADNNRLPIPLQHSILDFENDEIGAYNNFFVLNSITQLQIFVRLSEL